MTDIRPLLHRAQGIGWRCNDCERWTMSVGVRKGVWFCLECLGY